MYHNMYGLFGGGFSSMMFGGLFLIILIIIILYLLFRQDSQGSGYHTNKKSALDILDEEYAKGNISEEEYMKKKNNLR
ncbi:SHOCT domain-containing protein [Alkalibacterium sp. f15]|uniref:SHOCT domain-containing protein n=1 Tax=Alkalibacterium sp. f15 TaxID=3414029 RepID=UPI003BF8BA1E